MRELFLKRQAEIDQSGISGIFAFDFLDNGAQHVDMQSDAEELHVAFQCVGCRIAKLSEALQGSLQHF